MINGESTAEADYSALHISILYCERGIRFSGDPYSVGDYSRDLVKRGFNIAVNADNRRSALSAISVHAGISQADAAGLLNAIEHRHRPINDAFCSDAGMRLMRIDSELILRSQRAANDDGYGALPIHDSLIAPARCIDLTVEKMVEAFETLVGRVNPCKVSIKEGKVPHKGVEYVLLGPDRRKVA